MDERAYGIYLSSALGYDYWRRGLKSTKDDFDSDVLRICGNFPASWEENPDKAPRISLEMQAHA